MPAEPSGAPIWGQGFGDDVSTGFDPVAPSTVPDADRLVAEEPDAGLPPARSTEPGVDTAASEPSAIEAAPTLAPAPRSGAGVIPAQAPSDVGPEPMPTPDPDPADDWLGRICPYLLSEDGTYRSTQPDEHHRCTAQEPNGTLPLAFQERFCLSDRHVRCEMYKYAQETRSASFDDDGVSAEQVQSARFRPSVRSTPVAIASAEPAGGDSDGAARRPLIIGAAALGALVVVVVLTVLLTGGGDEGAGADVAGASPTSDASGAVASVAPSPASTPAPTVAVDPTPDAGSTPDPAADAGPRLISYQVQEGEALLRIADNFGTSRRRIIQANEGMADKKPYVVPGDTILVPASSELTIEELESFPGYQGPAS